MKKGIAVVVLLFIFGLRSEAVDDKSLPDDEYNNSVNMLAADKPTKVSVENTGQVKAVQKLRASIKRDPSLSTKAKNIKIHLTQGDLILNGPVQDNDEILSLIKKASLAIPDAVIKNELFVSK